MAGATDLSGDWDGIFNYPRLYRPTTFVATLREHDGAISGEITEPGQVGVSAGQTLSALIDGHRTGSTVRFIKTYDHQASPVHYEGTLDADATEISGSWRIPGNWSGPFIMVRRTGKAEAVEQRTAETIDL